MSRAVILYIRPEWTKFIVSGEKTVELRKTKPKNIQTPFRTFIYETKGLPNKPGRGKVIGEFICDEIRKDVYPSRGIVREEDQKRSCVSIEGIIDYATRTKRNAQLVYWWNITQLKLYANPYDLSELTDKNAPISWMVIDVPEGK